MADWISPTGHEDPGNVWDGESNAYDDNTNTYSLHGFFDPDTWTDYLILTVDAVGGCNKVRFNVYNSNLIIKLDIYKDGAWEEVYSGSYTEHTWQEKTFSAGTVSKARMKFYNPDTESWQAAVYEFDFYGTRIPAFYEGHYTPDFDTGEFYAYADQIIKIFPKLQQYKDQVIKTLPRLGVYEDSVVQYLPRLIQYKDQLSKFLPELKEYLDKLIKFEVSAPAPAYQYDDKTIKLLVSLSDLVDKCIQLLPRLTTYSDELVTYSGAYSSDYSSSDFDADYEKFPGQIFRLSPRFINYFGQTIKILGRLSGYSDKVVKLLPKVQNYVDKYIKVLPKLLTYSDELITGAFSENDYSDTDYDVYRLPEQLFQFLPKLAESRDQIIKFLAYLKIPADKDIRFLPRFLGYSDEPFGGSYYSEDYSEVDFDVYRKIGGQIFRMLPRLQEFTDQILRFVAEYETFEHLFVITVTRGEYDPLITIYKLLRDNWSLGGDLSKDNLIFGTGWYSDAIYPQITVTPLRETDTLVESGLSPHYQQNYSILVNIWVRPKQDSNKSLGWSKYANYVIRKEVERILKENARLDTGPYEQFITLRRWRQLDETDTRPVIFRTELEIVDTTYRKS